MGVKWGRVFRKNYIGHMEKTNEGVSGTKGGR